MNKFLLITIIYFFNFNAFAQLDNNGNWISEFKNTKMNLCSKAMQKGKPLEIKRFKESVSYIYDGYLNSRLFGIYKNVDEGRKYLSKLDDFCE